MKHFRMSLAVVLSILGLTCSAMAQTGTAAQYMQAGNTAYGAKNYDLAIKYYQAATSLNPNYGAAYQGLGNCYYLKGDNANALTSYEKAQSLDPNNASLNAFVQSLKAKVGTAPAAPASSSANQSVASAKVGNASAATNFELNVGVGGGFDTGGSTLGLGGAISGFYMLDKSLGLGGVISVASYGYPTVSVSGTYINTSLAYGTYTETVTSSVLSIGVMAALKYKFEGNGLTPYLVGGLGIDDLSGSGGATYSYNNGPPSSFYSYPANSSYSASTMDPMIGALGGLQFSAGKGLDIFVESGLTIVIGSGATATLIPFDAGLSFGF